MTASVMIEAQGVDFSYGKSQVLHDVTMQVNRGEIVALLGPNGVGKTTLVENLVGTLSPTAGTVRILGEDPKKARADFLTRIGLVLQHWADHPKWQVREQLRWIAAANQASGRSVRDIDEIVAAVGLTEKVDDRLNALSGGQRRRVDLAAALLTSPQILLLDEPTTGLDPVGKSQIHELLGAAVDDGVTVFLTTHDLNEAEKVATRIIVLKEGRIIADAAPWQLREQLVGKAQITWQCDGRTHVHATDAVESFVATLPLEEISNLTITRPTLEDAYLSLMNTEGSAA